MPGKHIVGFGGSLILIKGCCSLCVRSYLKITYKSITTQLIKKESPKPIVFNARLQEFAVMMNIYKR